MKKILAPLYVALLAFIACNQADPALVGKLEADSAKLKQTLPEIEANLRKVEELNKTLAGAPNGIRFNPESGYTQLLMYGQAIQTKYNSVKTLVEDVSHQMDSLTTNYSEGKLKKEEVEAALAALAPQVQGLDQVTSQINPIMEKVSADYAKLLEDWNALSEEQKNDVLRKAKPFATTPGTIAPLQAKPQ